eukprot:scaffold33924_cov60-Phaeocystis_antarctica.AAC.2
MAPLYRAALGLRTGQVSAALLSTSCRCRHSPRPRNLPHPGSRGARGAGGAGGAGAVGRSPAADETRARRRRRRGVPSGGKLA